MPGAQPQTGVEIVGAAGGEGMVTKDQVEEETGATQPLSASTRQ